MVLCNIDSFSHELFLYTYSSTHSSTLKPKSYFYQVSMAEIFGAVASGAGLLSLSIQLLDSAQRLKGFYNATENAPQTVADLSFDTRPSRVRRVRLCHVHLRCTSVFINGEASPTSAPFRQKACRPMLQNIYCTSFGATT
jgi:hypothetical protein